MGATAIIQARMGSTRLPGKVLKPLEGHPMLWHVVQRVRATPGLAEVVVATPESSENDAIRAFCAQEGIAVFSGSEEDVLDRYYQAARAFAADPVVRVTSDCPMVDPNLIGRLLILFGEGGYDYAGIAIGGAAKAFGVNGYPSGLDAECFSFAALERAWREATLQPEREHVTPYIWCNKDRFRNGMHVPAEDWSNMRLSVDEPEDFTVAERIYEALYREGEPAFGFDDVTRFLAAHPEVVELNRRFIGKEKYRDLWDAAAPGDGEPLL